MTTSNPLYDAEGKRLYLTSAERDAFLTASENAAREVRTFCNVLYYTGCRLSEALALTPARFDYSGYLVIFETLKKRQRGIFREVPVPYAMLDLLHSTHGLRDIQKASRRTPMNTPLWSWERTTAWRRVKTVMIEAGIEDGPHRTPKGLRHGYAIHALNKNVPLNMVSKWMGHSKMETTAIYANAVGEEQQTIAARMWQ